MKPINRYIDHTLLKADATPEDIKDLCGEAKKYQFFSVCLNSGYVSLAKKELRDSQINICAVVGFPLGAMSSEAKVFEAKQALKDGASEIDMVMNIGEFIAGNYEKVKKEIATLKKAVGSAVLKVILETCYLSSEEIVLASELAVAAQADFVKTSTGFGTGGASLEDIELMKKACAGKARIKASGGIKNLETAKEFIGRGADRIGTSSGVSIVKALKK